MLGYLDDPLLTEKAFESDYFKTGDLAAPRADGYLRLVDVRKTLSRGQVTRSARWRSRT